MASVEIRCDSTADIAQPIDVVWQFVVVNFFDNYPRWSPQVRSVRKLTDGPIAIGTRGHQERIDHGRRTESYFVVSSFVPREQICFEGEDYPYRIRYALEPVDYGTHLTFCFELTSLPGAVRPFRSLVQRVVERTTASVAEDIRELVERRGSGGVEPATAPYPDGGTRSG